MRVVARTSGSGVQRIGGTGIRSIMPEGRAYARTDAHVGAARLVLCAGRRRCRAAASRARSPSSGCPTSQARSSCRRCARPCRRWPPTSTPTARRKWCAWSAATTEPSWIEAWVMAPNGWRLMTAPALAVPGRAGQAEARITWAVRCACCCAVRTARSGSRSCASPHFAESDDPDDPEECCLLLDDLVLASNSIRLARVADPGPVADTVHAIDLDGDGTDRAARHVVPLAPERRQQPDRGAGLPLGRGSLRCEPTVTRLPVGSGSSPFVLGDSDGIPGDEAGLHQQLGARRACSGSASIPTTQLITEDSGLIVDDALAVPLSAASRGSPAGPEVRPRGPLVAAAAINRGVPIAAQPMHRARLLGVVEIGGAPGCSCTAPIRMGSRFAPSPTCAPTVVA